MVSFEESTGGKDENVVTQPEVDKMESDTVDPVPPVSTVGTKFTITLGGMQSKQW